MLELLDVYVRKGSVLPLNAVFRYVIYITAVYVQKLLYRLPEEIHISLIILRTHSRLHVSDKVWVGDGGAKALPYPSSECAICLQQQKLRK